MAIAPGFVNKEPKYLKVFIIYAHLQSYFGDVLFPCT
jgi:hypothetical protein